MTTARSTRWSRRCRASTAKATSFTLWFDTLMQAEDANVYLDNLAQLYADDITPDEFVKNVAAQLEKK